MGLFGGILKVAGIAGSIATGNPAIAAAAFVVANKIDKGKKQSSFEQLLNAGGQYVTRGAGAGYGSTSQAALLSSAIELGNDRRREEPPAYEPPPGYAAFDAYSRPGAAGTN